MNDEQIPYLPFHAINEFMVDEYRLTVLRSVLGNMETVPSELRTDVLGQIKEQVKLPGFRNAAHAPLPLKTRSAADVFRRSPQFVASVIAAWAAQRPELAQRIHAFLQSKGWELLPVDADRRMLPGFRTRWEGEDTFATLDDAYRAAHTDDDVTDDDLNLMIVWLSGRLPYDDEEEEAFDEDDFEETTDVDVS